MLKELAVLSVCTIPLHVHAQTAVLTRSSDNSRTGSYQESLITVANLKGKGLSLRTIVPVIGDARGMEAQPLILPGVKLADGSTHDVMVLPSMANVVRGVDAHTGAGLWQATLGRPVDVDGSIDMYGINQHIGVLSTDVIDPATKRVYMVAIVSPDGSPAKGVHMLYTLDVASGVILGTPASFAGLRNGTQAYLDTPRKQRSSLVLTHIGGHTMIFGAHGAQSEVGSIAAGAIFAYDATLGKFTAWQPTDLHAQAGIWMGGQGLAADANGDLFGQTGNGDFNGTTDLAESMFKAHYTPATATAPASITFVTHMTPYSDRGRVGLDPAWAGPGARLTGAKLAGVSAPTEDLEPTVPVGGAMKMPVQTRTVISHDVNTGKLVPLVYPKYPTRGGWGDEDLGSGGCTLADGAYFLNGKKRLFCGGKDGLLYEVFADAMGDTMPADFANVKANCAKMAAPPIWFTASPGPVDPCPQDQTTLDFFPWGKSRHLHMTPVQYMSPKDGLVLWGWGENSTLHKWRVGRDGQEVYEAESLETASAQSTYNTGGMPGGMCSLSSDHNRLGTAILWCSIPLGDANRTVTGGELLAYDAENVYTDASGTHPVKLYDSRDRFQYQFNKFMPPVIWDGEVILPNYSGGVMILAEQP